MYSPWITLNYRGAGAVIAGLSSAWLWCTPVALAQNTDRPPDAAAPAQAGPVAKPGFFQSIGRWLDQGASNFREHLRGAKQRMDDLGDEASANRGELREKAAEVGKNAAEATKNAVDAVTKLPTARVMSGHERCAVAPNGAPDCVAAAVALCRKHGYQSGSSIDFTSAEQCPPRVLLSGQQSRLGCTTVTFVSRAMCQ